MCTTCCRPVVQGSCVVTTSTSEGEGGRRGVCNAVVIISITIVIAIIIAVSIAIIIAISISISIMIDTSVRVASVVIKSVSIGFIGGWIFLNIF